MADNASQAGAPGRTTGESCRLATASSAATLSVLILRGCLVGLFLVLLGEAVYLLLGANFRTVIPRRIYRSARLSSRSLERLIQQYGIRTVINLRGCCEPASWYLDQSRILNRLDVSMEDVGCSAGRLPSIVTIRQLVQILDHTDYPIMVHCHRGIDRTGLVSAMALLLQTDITLDKALAQLSWRYAHLPIGKTGNMERFFVLYREWLERTGQEHSRSVFRRWVEHDYCPGECRAQIELLAPAEDPVQLEAGKPAALRVRCVNTSVKPWHFKPGLTAGIHLQYMLHSSAEQPVASARTGQFYATVEPGESIDLLLALPSLLPGRYLLRADLIDEQHASFFQLGSVPLFREVVVK